VLGEKRKKTQGEEEEKDSSKKHKKHKKDKKDKKKKKKSSGGDRAVQRGALTRIRKELKDIMQNPPGNCSGWAPDPEDLFEWTCAVSGPAESPYDGGMFYIRITFPDDYPFSPPQCTMKTKIYHCNFDASGGICLDVLKDNWSPALTVSKLLLSITSLMAEPNPADPLTPRIAKHLKEDREAHDQVAVEWTNKYARV
jgi:ubiquitin-protein ligase